MIYDNISGIGKGSLVIMEKNWNKVTAEIYRTRVLSYIYRHLDEIRRVTRVMPILMKDNASIHTAKLTKEYHAYYGVERMEWPARSSDLNPIENVWRLLKARVGRRCPRTDAEVRQYIQEEWDRMDLEDFKKYIESMPERCQAVIDADGEHTKW